MKLAQIGRKTGVKPHQIVCYLREERGINVEASPNFEIGSEVAQDILQHFASGSTTAIDKENIMPVKEATEHDVNNFKIGEENAVIKAPKIEVGGVKVVGKVELQEKKENPSTKENTEKKKEIPNTKPKKRQSTKKTLTTEEKEAREQIIRERAVKKKWEEEKRKKRAHYEKKTKGNTGRKSPQQKKSKVKTIKEQEKKQEQESEKPETLWGKFMYWLNH